jgi:hypothetical protein
MASLRVDAWVSRKGQRLEKTTESYQEYSLSILGSLMTEMQAGAAQEGRGRVGGNIYVWNEDLKFPDLLDLPPERIEVQKITNQIEQNNKLKGSSQGLFQNGRQMHLWHSGNLRKLQTMLQPFVRPSLLKPSVSKYKNKGIPSPTSNLLYSVLNPQSCR